MTDYFSKRNFDAIKGYLALGVLVHHISQFRGVFGISSLEYIFMLLGSWCVGGFFMMSGYGLVRSYKTKGETYINGFFRKRFLPYYLEYCVVLAGYVVFWLLFNGNVSIKDIFISLTFGSTLIAFGWYLQMLYVLYIMFFISFKFVKKDLLKIYVLAVELIIFIIVLRVIANPHALSVIPFLIGVLLGWFSDEVTGFMAKNKWMMSIICMILLFIYAVIRLTGLMHVDDKNIEAVTMLSTVYVDYVIVCYLTMFNNVKWPISNAISDFLGRISYEMYIIQGIVLISLNRYVNNTVFFIAFSVVLTIIAAVIINKLRLICKTKKRGR